MSNQPQYPQMGPQHPSEPPDRHQYPPLQTGLINLPLWVPGWVPRDPVTLGIIAAAAFGATVCLCAFCLGVWILARPIPTPAPPPTQAVVIPTQPPLVVTATTNVPTFDPGLVNTLLNPYIDARLDGMTGIVMSILDPGAGGYVQRAQIVAGTAEMEGFITALNIANYVQAPDPTCPNHVVLTIARADGSVANIGICLKNAVILRGDIPNLRGGDLLMGPFFSDLLRPYLPDAYQRLLGF